MVMWGLTLHTQGGTLSYECAQNDPHIEDNIQGAETMSDQPRPEVDPQASVQGDDGGTQAHHEPNSSSNVNCEQQASMSGISSMSSGNNQDIPPLDNCAAPHNPNPDTEDPQPRDEDEYQGQDAQPDDHPGGPNDWNPDEIVPHLDALQNPMEFTKGQHGATLDNDTIPFNVCERLWSPIMEPLQINKLLHFCLDVYLATTNGSEASYDNVCAALNCLSPDIGTPLSSDQLK